MNIYPDLIILAGGFGTRLESVSNGIPKPLMPVGDSVYLDLLLSKVFKYNISNIYLSLHYKAEIFEEYLENSVYSNKLSTIIEPTPLGTGGAINYVINSTNISSLFFVVNGDSLSDLNFDKMATYFNINNFLAMIGISKVYDTARYGSIVEKNSKITKFKEKGGSGSGWINNGHYLFKKEIFNEFNGVFSLENDVLPSLIDKGKLGSYKVNNDNFIDMGIPDDYFKIKNEF